MTATKLFKGHEEGGASEGGTLRGGLAQPLGNLPWDHNQQLRHDVPTRRAHLQKAQKTHGVVDMLVADPHHPQTKHTRHCFPMPENVYLQSNQTHTK